MNDLTFSYDLSCAVRISDGLRLVAVPDHGAARCEGCAVPLHADTGSCSPLDALCNGARRCRGPGERLITWRPA